MSDSDSSESESESDTDDAQILSSNQSMLCDEDDEGKTEIELNSGKAQATHKETDKEVTIDEDSIPVFTYRALKSSDSFHIPAELINFFNVERNELLMQLQHDLLVKWFYFQKHTVSFDCEFPSTVAQNLYIAVYSSDAILSTKASETLALLYQEFTTEVKCCIFLANNMHSWPVLLVNDGICI